MPPAEVAISVELVVALLQEQHPDLADLAVEFVSEGWDSAVFRLGSELAIRLPRRRINADLLPNELRWLPQIAPHLTLPVPVPIRAGVAGCGFPWGWSITTWFEGETWAESGVGDPKAAATALGRFVAGLGVEAPHNAPKNPYRGGPLADRDPAFRERAAQLPAFVDRAGARRVWDDGLAAPPPTSRRWLHGDLHPANIVVQRGELSAVIDWVDLSAGDQSYDLAAAWLFFPADPAARAEFVDATEIDDAATWQRARACALSHAVACLTNSADNERMRSIGERTLRAVLAEPS